MSDKEKIVTIDGPAGVGKSTISRKVAAALGFTYLDTGAMYRGVAWYLQQQGVDVDNVPEIERLLDSIELELLPANDEHGDVGVRVGGKDISREIRLPEVSMLASAVSRIGIVREKLTTMQQAIGRRGSIVAEGRDTGTVVFPQAQFKFFLDAQPQVRARRRVLQLRAKGESADEQEILQLTLERDKNDRERALAPLCKAEDAVEIDTTEIDVEQVSSRVLGVIASKM